MVDSNQVLLVVVTLLLLWGLHAVVWKTRMGTAMRAVSLNPQAAALVGVLARRRLEAVGKAFSVGDKLAVVRAAVLGRL